MMKLAFCLFNYFSYGGLQRDFLRIASTCLARGHKIHVYTMRWEGAFEPNFHLHLIEVKGWQNHVRCRQFTEKVRPQLEKSQYDLVIGFNKMPFLDLYYAADVCYVSRIWEQRHFLYRLLPRYRQWVALENAVFEPAKKTQVMLISAQQIIEYQRYYHTESERLHLLPPGIAKDRIAPSNAASIRKEKRENFHLTDKHLLLLMVGSSFKTKGLDRALKGMAALPASLLERCHLLVIGEGNARPFIKLATQLGIEKHLQFLGGRSDVPEFLLAADLLLHPAYHENTGTVLLEAMVAGLPVLTVSTCGYAHYVDEATAGRVLPTPFQQAAWNELFKEMLLSPERTYWHQNGLAFAKCEEIYHLPEKAADLIELIGYQRDSLLTSTY
jgi:UDP-glucose:(heptosyl)LPS alpha-1,3-glucosyltransferase